MNTNHCGWTELSEDGAERSLELHTANSEDMSRQETNATQQIN